MPQGMIRFSTFVLSHFLKEVAILRRFMVAALLFASVAVAAHGQPGRYVIRLADPPLASYRGGITGLAPTNPATLGRVKLDANSPASRAYLDYLSLQQAAFRTSMEQALGRAVQVLFDYRHAYNGMGVVLTPPEAALVAQLPAVKQVKPEFTREIVTDAGPAWIGAPAIWGGTGTGGLPGKKGEGIVVGIIDTGVNHDHPSFADSGGDGFNHNNLRGRFFGLCDPVTGAPFCNDKLIGVHDFTGTTPLDDNGHGSHTASTTAGNFLSAAIQAPTLILQRSISGVAPHANLITYKACLAIGSCAGLSLVAAIEQATADGVDVINYSIGGGSNDPWEDDDAIAFLGARDAGIFVAVSAGNSGPGAETVGSPADAPWLLAVGAGTHNRAFVNALVNMSGGATTPPSDIQGKSFTSGYGPATIVHARDFGDAQCLNPFPPGTFSGHIVICDRGINPRVEKGRNVRLGGAGGMVLANTAAEGESTVADPHELPAVHIGFKDAQVLAAWVGDGGTGHTARIAGTTINLDPKNGDVVAGFSSRGPNPSVPDVLKPDIAGPGVDILAAVNTTNPTAPPEFALNSGTSMSSPHLAGSAALIRALHPEWTPAEVQSALMTTALTTTMRKEDGLRAADAFDIGGGRVDLSKAGRAGLVLDESALNFENADPDAGGKPSTLNLGSLANGACKAQCSWTRIVRNTLQSSATWMVGTNAPRNMSLTVTPSRFTLEPGAAQELTVTADVRKAPLRKWLLANVKLRSQSEIAPDAQLPLAVRAGAPKEVNIETIPTSGSHLVTGLVSDFDIKNLSSEVFGLTEGVVEQKQVLQDPTPLDPYDGLGGTFFVLVNVPAGARFLIADIAKGKSTARDVDLFMGRDKDGDRQPDAAEELCAGTSPTAVESCELGDPEAGTYWVMVQNFLLGRIPDDVELVVSVIPNTDNGNLTVSGPKSVAAGQSFDVTLSWNEPAMESGDSWFALVQLGSSPGHPNNVSLLVRITRK